MMAENKPVESGVMSHANRIVPIDAIKEVLDVRLTSTPASAAIRPTDAAT